jgi:hypothetical protein
MLGWATALKFVIPTGAQRRGGTCGAPFPQTTACSSFIHYLLSHGNVTLPLVIPSEPRDLRCALPPNNCLQLFHPLFAAHGNATRPLSSRCSLGGSRACPACPGEPWERSRKGSAVQRTSRGNVFRHSVAERRDLRLALSGNASPRKSVLQVLWSPRSTHRLKPPYPSFKTPGSCMVTDGG